MENTDPKFDAYIAKAPAYAQPIITHLRKLIHQAVPQVTEVMKWGHPHFDYKGPFMGLAAFKEHMGLNFWKSTLMDDPAGLFAAAEKGSAGSIGKIRSMGDLPADDVLLTYILSAADLNDRGVKLPPPKKAEVPKELEMPTDVIEAFKANTGALQHFEKFSPSAKREYITWLDETKSAVTRQKRLDTMMEWVSEGKTRHWKYK